MAKVSNILEALLTANNTQGLRVIEHIVHHFGAGCVVALWCREFRCTTIWSVETSSAKCGLALLDVILGAAHRLLVRLAATTGTLGSAGQVLARAIGLDLAAE